MTEPKRSGRLGQASRSTTNDQRSTTRGPELLGDILGRLFTTRGWGRRQDRLRLEEIWAEVVGPEFAPQTRVGGIRRGVLEVVVGNAVLLQELTHYHKRGLLEKLRAKLPGTTLNDLRFRAGVITEG